MKKICILGPVDKRILTYPLIKVLDLTGKLLVVTDDANFRRFDSDLGLRFIYGQTQFIIMPVISEEALSKIGVRMNDYDYTLFISTNELIHDADSIVYCHGINKSMLDDDNLEYLDELEHKEVIISPNKVPESKDEKEKKNNVIKIDVLKDSLHYVYTCEENRSFMYQSKPGTALPKMLSFLFEDSLGLKSDTIAKILERKE